MGEGSTTCRYAIDADDRIVSVGGNWREFAERNGAAELSAPHVLGRPIWSFIAGYDTRDLYKEMFRRLRMGPRELLVPFRCDSPNVVRDMSLLMSSSGDGTIRLEGRLNAETEREFVPALARHVPRREDSLRICALCRRIEVEDRWLGATARRARALLFDPKRIPGLDETVCPDCNARAMGAGESGPGGRLSPNAHA